MNQFNDYLSYGVIFLGLLFFLMLAIKYWRYWKQLQEALLQTGTKWPPYSQEELNENARKNLPDFYKMGSKNMTAGLRVIFSMKTDTPAIQKPRRGIRRVLLAFVIFPIMFAVILVFIAALAEV